MSSIPWIVRPLESRLYVDIIHQTTSQYANFTPSAPYALGDYGYVDSKSGRFMREGSIFDLFPELQGQVQTKSTPKDLAVHFGGRSKFLSKPIDLHSEGILPDYPNDHKWGWTYEKDRHAALLIKDIVEDELLYEGRIKELLTTDEKLRRKAVLFRLTRCASYAALLTSGQGQATIGLKVADAASPPPPQWAHECDTGTWATGASQPGNYKYFPLFTLCQISKTRRNPRAAFKANPSAEEMEIVSSALRPYFRPWGELDPEGIDMDDENDADEE